MIKNDGQFQSSHYVNLEHMFFFCSWSHRELTVKQWSACCPGSSWVQKVSWWQSTSLRSICPGCGWRNTPTRTARSACLTLCAFLLCLTLVLFFVKRSICPLGLHVGFLPRLWHQLQFFIRWSYTVTRHVWVHERRVSWHGPDNCPSGLENPRPQPQTQYYFVWHRSVWASFSFT